MRSRWNLKDLFTQALQARGLSLHLHSGLPAVAVTPDGVVPLTEHRLTRGDCAAIAAMISNQDVQRLNQESLSGQQPGICRYRAEIYRQRDVLSLVFKLSPWQLPPLHELSLPPNLPDLIQAQSGLILVCGPRGAGKSWTLAGMLDHIHRNRAVRSLVLGSPLEFELEVERGLSTSHSVTDEDWEDTLEQVEYSDIDVVALDDVPVRRTLQRMLDLAEAGILVLATVRSAFEVNCFLFDLWTQYPEWLHPSLKERVALSLQAVLFQKLVPGVAEAERFPATELVVPTAGMRNLIREERYVQFYNHIQTGGRYGMHTLEQSLFQLLRAGNIDEDTALSETRHPEDMKRLIEAWRGGA